jgi:hypothetical protein
MNWLREASIAELLAEPIVQMVMVQDGVTVSELRTVLEEASARMDLKRECPRLCYPSAIRPRPATPP